MGYRLVGLLETPSQAALISPFTYEAVFKEEQLCLKGQPSPDGPTRQPLRDLILAARRHECRLLAKQDERFSGSKGIDGKTVFEILHFMCEHQPQGSRNPGGHLTWTDLVLLRDLENEAERIRNRKTIFLVPDYWPGTSPRSVPLERLLDSIAEELNGRLDGITGRHDVGFVKLRRPDQLPAERARDPGLMRSIVGKLLAKANKSLGQGVLPYGEEVPEGPLLIDGPTGSGKSMAAELVATTLGKKFVKVNIAAVTESILESQMRGHVKGAFTNAHQAEDGWFAKADGGVLFLDEFQNASLASQTQLLDLLDPVSDDIFINRIGEAERRRYNVKVILAVNKPVRELLADGKLREDLFYRIRTMIKFRTLNEVIDGTATPDDKARMIRKLVQIYRWKSSPCWQTQVRDEADFPPLFPIVDDSVVDPIANFRWEGNYRQFERVITSIHWHNDKQKRSTIDGDQVRARLDEECLWLGAGSLPVGAGGQLAWDRRHLDVVQELLLENRFNIGKTVEALKPRRMRLGSRQSLRSFLREHRESLRPEIRTDSKIISFLGSKA
ncbi:hypothetical protein C1S70_31110 (plasmid) [Azospirillum argentinense]|uniref:Sigma-54 factor interaction domain-containing protein n=1 Tax=Azospirillum argentinense TaxID=2970906 RepID=A0A2K1FR57_9PROT|nr:sigma 54-interacting transcriptional regulator [Azospirillum argentinense]PNQ95025.1 hypothetical protein C1S70_31110 [Azospirillum argentinense]